nr:unnamed protein product [Callosobruchus analis]
MVPPDGGWGWLVLFGATMVNILIPGTIKSFGVLFVEFGEVFDASKAEVIDWRGLRGPWYDFGLLGKLSVLPLLLIWNPSWLWSWAFIPPTVYIVCSYFVKLRGVANGICISGSAFGSILIPPLLRVILDTYSTRGTMLIMGGLTLNVFVAALFYDKVELHMKREPIEKKDEEADTLQAKFIISQEDSLPSLPHADSFLEQLESSEGSFNRSVSSAAVQNLKSKEHRERKISMPMGKHEVMKAKAGHSMSSNTTLHAVPEKESNGGKAMEVYSQSRLPSTRRRSAPKRSTSTSSFQYISTPYHGSTLTLQPEIFASSFSLKSGAKGKTKEEEVKKPKLFDISLLKDPIYLVILISNATNAISYTNFLILLPSYAQTLNFDKNQGALLLSIVSALDLVGRIGGSALSDLTNFPKCWYFVIGLLVSGISLGFMPLFGNYWVIAAFCCLFGVSSGVYVGVTAIVMADMLGEERLQSTYGMGLFVNGILQLVGPPLCGLWYEAVKSYVSLFISLGITITAGASLWIFVPCFQRKAKEKEQLSA